MPFNVDSPMDLVSEPARYPSPDWTKDAEVTTVLMPGDGPVGWLIIQDDMALTWVSSAGPDRPGAYAAKVIVQDALAEALATGLNCRDAQNLVRSRTLVGPPSIQSLKALAEHLGRELL